MKMTLKAKLMNGQTRLLPEAMESLNKMCDRVSEKAFFAKGVQQRQGRQEQDAETNRSDLFRWAFFLNFVIDPPFKPEGSPGIDRGVDLSTD
ncbi:MAG: hypothetical protein ACYCXP_04820 [Leptospirillum sp.]